MLAAISSSASLQIFTSAAVASRRRRSPLSPAATSCRCHCSLTDFREMSTQPQTSINDTVQLPNIDINDDNIEKKNIKRQGLHESEEEEEKWISKIQVPRQKYIPTSKTELLSGIVSNMFHATGDVDDQLEDFLLLSSCLDSIIHAEHKSVLEEMRSDYFQQTGNEEEGSAASDGQVFDNGNGRSIEDDRYGAEEIEFENPISFNYVLDLRKFLPSPSPKNVKRVAVATRFQRAFMQLLNDAQFEELSARDLMLTSALNSDYLLTLPIYVDWKKAAESNAIIFRRGYATERQKGLLIVEKLDYLQSKLLRGIFFTISKPLGKLGSLIIEAFKSVFQTEEAQDWTKRFELWLKDLSTFQQSLQQNEETSDDLLGVDEFSEKDLPIWLAAQRAVSRYEGLLSPVGPRGRLLKQLLTFAGLVSPTPETPFELDGDTNASEPYKGPIFLSRISLGDIWRPATRKFCGNDIWKMLKTSVSILFSKSVLQVRLDVATILGLSAYFINYKFENVLLSPSAILLDVVAITALIISVSRVVLGYKQTWDRYQLLVNRTLYEKTLASGFGSVHFLLDASEQQQYKEAILAYAIMLKMGDKMICRRSVGDKCEQFMYAMFKVKVEMPVDKAISTLLRLGLATESSIDGRIILQAVPCSKAYEALKMRWNSLLS
ncbi:uncharacterized protein LOC115712710 isoform X2 [Cannabis sativa]|uniref:uncharacterized protein LOC115712710 isoform X2 n=1 Tax=Cannabis sativa TaxID=3483 RepID=UPI0029CA2E1A|nr:uncharacterized protein LOC115712710 isoform X2 [Cannabis sativa]